MTLGRALARLKYKPGWTFGIGTAGELVVSFQTHDSTKKRPTQVIGLMVRFVPPKIVSEVRRGRRGGFYQWVARLIREREEHEVREWLKVDGKHMVDPHPELRA